MKLRILQVAPDLIPYGLERVVGSLALLARRDRFEISVASLYDEAPGSLAPELRAQGIRVFHLGKRRGLDVRLFSRLYRLFRRERPHIIHTHNYVLRYVLPAALAGGARILHTIHNVADREVDRVGLWLQRRAFPRWVHPVVIAEEGAASFERVYGIPRPPLIRNGIPVERYAHGKRRRALWRQKEGFAESDVLIVCVARFWEQKNHRTLVEAFANGPAQQPGVYLLLAGEGSLRPAIERQAADSGIGDRVCFLGRREDVPEILGASDIFALASLWEGNPLAVMEAMAAGLPCVVTAVGGVPELVANGCHGFVVPAGDARGFASALLHLTHGAQMRAVMGRAAAEHAQARFGQQQMVEGYERLYEELVGGTSRSGPATQHEIPGADCRAFN